MNPIIDPWLKAVHATGSEISVTMIVSGRTMTGYLTPSQRYRLWEEEVLRRTGQGGGHFTLPSTELGPIDEKLQERVRAEWPNLEKEVYEDGLPDSKGFAFACVRNAWIYDWRSSLPGPLTLPMLLVSVHAVAACSPGVFDAEERGLKR
jgi:hypothetical protein